jgi:hypothetical protein
MRAYRLTLSTTALAIMIAISGGVGYAQEITIADVGKIYKLDGFYVYNPDGVPLIGIVTRTAPKNDHVMFTSCSNTTVPVDFNKLKLSNVPCPDQHPDPNHGPWTTASKRVVPIFRIDSANGTFMVKSEDQTIDLSSLPTSYKDPISKAKSGEWVGYTFTDGDGKKSVAIGMIPNQ